MNIFDRIKQDHDEAREVMSKLKDTTERAKKTRQDLFNHFKLDMWVHHKVEEAVFYSILRETKEMHGDSMEAYNEHHIANGMIEELDTFPVDSEDWLVKFKALTELVEHHMDEEEEDFFPTAKKLLDKETQELMGERFDQRKKVVMAALAPLELEKTPA